MIDSDKLEVKKTIPVGQRPRGIMLTKDGKSLLICASDDDTIQILDLASGAIVGDLALGTRSRATQHSPLGQPGLCCQ